VAYISYQGVEAALRELDAGNLENVRATLREALFNKAEPALREAANQEWGSDDREIDDETPVSVGDDGVWVAAWVWMPGWGVAPAEEEEDQDDATPAA